MTKPLSSSMRGICCNENTSLERLWVRMKMRIIGKERCTKKTPQKTCLCLGKLKLLKSEMCHFFSSSYMQHVFPMSHITSKCELRVYGNTTKEV